MLRLATAATLARMPVARLDRLLLAGCLLVAAAAFLTGLTWGLPSRAGDAILFGGRAAWSGAQIQALSEARVKLAWDDPTRGADVDADPLAKPAGQLVRLNPPGDIAAVAEVVRRYRLFSYQPDEMITFMALAKMRPAELDFDPRLYQYGGLWVYPVGALLRAASTLRYVDLRGGGGGLTYFMDDPAAFGRFYVVARLYVAGWGLIGAWAVFAIVRRITGSPGKTGSPWAAAGAAVAFAVMPVVVNMAHEAKPHLPGMVLVLLAVLGAARYVETGKLSYALAAGALCGMALSMVLSTAPAFAVLPVMVLLRPGGWGDRARTAVFCGLVGLVVYGAANPYVAYHLLRGEGFAGGTGPLASNLGNSSAFYSVGRLGEGVANAVRLTAEGASPPLAAIGLLATVVLAVRAVRVRGDGSPEAVRRRAHGLLLATPAALTFVQAALVGAGKPGEFGRFLLLTDVFLAVEAFAYFGTRADGGPGLLGRRRIAIAGVLVALTASHGWAYLRGFVRDVGGGAASPAGTPETSRMAAAREIEALRAAGGKRLLLAAEPAPYGVPPVNLFDWPVLLVPKGGRPEAYAEPGDVVVEVVEGGAKISWADKRFDVRAVP
jgi:hypothetical protein